MKKDFLDVKRKSFDLFQNKKYNLIYSHRTKGGQIVSNPHKTNQDNFLILKDLNNDSEQNFFSVFDGHGTNGGNVSKFIVEAIPNMLRIQKELVNNPIKSLYNIYYEINEKISNVNEFDINLSGSTANCIYINKTKAFIANIGDSRAVLGRKKDNTSILLLIILQEWVAIPLSRDHKPCNKDEYERIIKTGGRIDNYRDSYGNSIGPFRVWLKNENLPGLAMSRSIGDKVAESVGVIWQPEIFEVELDTFDKFIILASDGIWDQFDNLECIQAISQFYEKNNLEGACDYLLKESNYRWQQVLFFLNNKGR